MSQEKPSLAEVLDRNRTVVLAILGVPVLGMTLAFVLIIYTHPSNMLILLAVIFFIAIQYAVMMLYFIKRVEMLVKKKQDEATELIELDEQLKEVNVTIKKGSMLEPEEKRVLPIKEE